MNRSQLGRNARSVVFLLEKRGFVENKTMIFYLGNATFRRSTSFEAAPTSGSETIEHILRFNEKSGVGTGNVDCLVGKSMCF